MSEPRDRRSPARRRLTARPPALLALLLTLLALAGLAASFVPVSAVWAQGSEPELEAPEGEPAPAEGRAEAPDAGPSGVASPEEIESLTEEIVGEYEILPVRGGVLLRPVAIDAPFRTLEITEEGLALDGREVDQTALRERLGEAAEPLLRWVAVPPAERSRALDRLAPGSTPTGEPREAEAPEPVKEKTRAPERTRMRTGDKVSLAGGVTIKEDEIAQEVVVVAGPLRVQGEVEGGAIVVGGAAYIDGTIGRELMVVGGNVHLGPDAVVEGDINIMAGGRVYREPGAEVRGRINELGVIGPLFGGDGDRDFDFRPRFAPFRWFSDLLGQLFWLATLGLLACLVVLFGQRAVEGVETTLASEPWTAGAAGLLFQILFVPLLVILILLLAISIVGIPLLLLLPFALLGLLVAGFVGFVGVALRLGRLLIARFGRSSGGVYVSVVAGIVALDIWMVLSEALDLPFLGFFSGLALVLGILIQYAAWTFGSGALLLRVGSRRRRRRTGARSEALPPIPAAPPASYDPDPERSEDESLDPERGFGPEDADPDPEDDAPEDGDLGPERG